MLRMLTWVTVFWLGANGQLLAESIFATENSAQLIDCTITVPSSILAAPIGQHPRTLVESEFNSEPLERLGIEAPRNGEWEIPPFSVTGEDFSLSHQLRDLVEGQTVVENNSDISGAEYVDCLALQRIAGQNRIMLRPRSNPKNGMEGGQPSFPEFAPLLQATLINHLSVAAPRASSEIASSPCSPLTSRTLDECFLPTVGLVRDGPTGEPSRVQTHCSGTIIGAHEILTAAHCVCDRPTSVLIGTGTDGSKGFYTPQSEDEYLLVQNDNEVIHLASILVSISSIAYMGEKFCDYDLETDIDIFESVDLAVISTHNPLPYPVAMRAVAIPVPGTEIIVNIAGFGTDPSSKTNIPSRKRYLSTRLRQRDGAMLEVAGPTGDSCEGDSGSGAYVRLESGRLGIFATLSSGRGRCSPNSSARYVALDGVRLAWVRSLVPTFDQIWTLDQIWSAKPSIDPNICLGRRCMTDWLPD